MTNNHLEHTLQPGMILQLADQVYEIVNVNWHQLSLHIRHLTTQTEQTLSLTDLLQRDDVKLGPDVVTLRPVESEPTSPDDADLPQNLLERADEMIRIVETVEALVNAAAQHAQRYGETFVRTKALEHAVLQLNPPIALSTFYKYRKRYQDHDGVRSQLAASLRRSSYRQPRVSAAQLHFIDTLILRYYARQRPLRPMTLYRLGQSILMRTENHWANPEQSAPEDIIEELLDHRLPFQTLMANPEKRSYLTAIQMPSRGWFYEYLRWFEAQPGQGESVITTRYGADTWEREYQIFDTFVSHAMFPLQYVFADHWLLDVFTVDEATRSSRQRLWLTLLIDAYSRSILGMALLYEHPGAMSIQRALQHAIWPKPTPTGENPDHVWVSYGIPQQLYLDNAWAHHSHSLEQLARAISQNGRYNGIDLVFRPPYQGRYGALIERFFGNLSGQVKEHLPGAIQSAAPKHIQQAAQQACLLYQDANEFLQHLILTYQHTPHRELDGATPHEMWCKGLGERLPLVPPQLPHVTRLFWRLDPRPRRLTSKGINAFGMQYWSPQLSGLARVGRDGKRIQYRIRYDPVDISCIALFHEGIWVGDAYARQLRQADGSMRELSLVERELAKDLARERHIPLKHWLAFVHELDELVQTRQTEKRRIQRQAGSEPPQSTDATPSDIDEHYTDLLMRFLTPHRGDTT
jgi:hypothetical protein